MSVKLTSAVPIQDSPCSVQTPEHKFSSKFSTEGAILYSRGLKESMSGPHLEMRRRDGPEGHLKIDKESHHERQGLG